MAYYLLEGETFFGGFQYMGMESEGSPWSLGSEGLSWRLLAVLEVATALLLLLALLLHALRTRLPCLTSQPRSLRGLNVLITNGESELGRALTRLFAIEGCAVSVLLGPEGEAREEECQGVRVVRCDARRAADLRALATSIGARSLDVLVLDGSQALRPGLNGFADHVAHQVYTNFHLLEELGGCVRAGGHVAWACGSEGAGWGGRAGGAFCGAARALQRLARTTLETTAKRHGWQAAWCAGPGAEAVLRRVAAPTHPAIAVFAARPLRNLSNKIRDVVCETFWRCYKIVT